MSFDHFVLVDSDSLSLQRHNSYDLLLGDYVGHDYLNRTSMRSDAHDPLKNKNSHFRFFAEAGSRGGLASKNRAKFRLSLICRLVREVLYRQPLEIKLPATEVAYEIHDDFASEVRENQAIYGDESTFGAHDKTIYMPFLALITREIRKQVKRGYELVKSAADKWYSAPPLVSA